MTEQSTTGPTSPAPGGEFVIAGWFDYGEHRDAVLEDFVACARASRDEDGCLDYWVAADPEDAGRLRVFERWASEPHLAAHFRTDHVVAFRDAVAGVPRVAKDVRRYFVSSGEEFVSSRVASA
ncbi:putative quinol monooxygenase [Jatrophihabitans fulvus]